MPAAAAADLSLGLRPPRLQSMCSTVIAIAATSRLNTKNQCDQRPTGDAPMVASRLPTGR
jgi:hypothetical protein